jgi:hypothetical protein
MGVTQQKLVRTNSFPIQATLNASTGGGCLANTAALVLAGLAWRLRPCAALTAYVIALLLALLWDHACRDQTWCARRCVGSSQQHATHIPGKWFVNEHDGEVNMNCPSL